MNDLLYINDELVDVLDNINISINYQINDLFELKDRQVSYSNTITLPLTERNKMLFSALGISGNTSIAPYRYHRVTYFKKGVQLFHNELAVIRSTSNGYKLNIYFDNIGLFEAIGDNKISDLNLSQFNHVLNKVNYEQRLNTYPILYPVADYGRTDNGIIEYNFQAPAISVRYLWNRIFGEAGFDYSPHPVFSMPKFRFSYISIDKGYDNKKDLSPPIFIGDYNRVGIFDSRDEYSIEFAGLTLYQIPVNLFLPIQFNVVNEAENYVSINNGKSIFTARNSGYHRIKIDGVLNNQTSEKAILVISVNGNLYQNVIELGENENENIAYNELIYLSQDDTFSFELKLINEDQNKRVLLDYDLNLNISLDNSNIVINFNEYWKDISQKDFIKDICNVFGLMFTRKGNTYIFKSYEDVFNPSPDEIDDWSYKLNRVLDESYTIGNFGQKNNFKYNYVNEDDTFADGSIRINNLTLKQENDVLTRPYNAPSNSIHRPLKLMRLYEDDKPKKTKPFIFTTKIQQGLTYKLAGSPETNHYSGSYNLAKFDELPFSKLIPEHMGRLSNVLNYSKKIVAELLLTELDLKELDFFRLKYFNQLGRYYYLNKIRNYTGNGFTKCEFIEVKNRERLGEFNQDFNKDYKI